MENSSVGMHVVQTRASDPDLVNGGGHHLRYSIVSGDPAGDFAVGERDGLVVVARALDYERRNSYRCAANQQARISKKPRGSTI